MDFEAQTKACQLKHLSAAVEGAEDENLIPIEGLIINPQAPF